MNFTRQLIKTRYDFNWTCFILYGLSPIKGFIKLKQFLKGYNQENEIKLKNNYTPRYDVYGGYVGFTLYVSQSVHPSLDISCEHIFLATIGRNFMKMTDTKPSCAYCWDDFSMSYVQ